MGTTSRSQGNQARKEAGTKQAIERLQMQPPGWWEQVRELAAALEQEGTQDREGIIKTLLEILFPVGLGEVADLEGDDQAAREKLESYRRSVGDAIRRLRLARNMTQEQLATAAGLPQSHVSKLEAGKHAPTQTTIARIARALDTTPSQIDPGCDDEDEE
jgi:DNA-binding XRE family transcriptional regulator